MTTNYYFTRETATLVLNAHQKGRCSVELSVDLNQTRQKLKIQNRCLVLDSSSKIEIGLLKALLKTGRLVFVYDGTTLYPAEVRGKGYYKLVPTDTAPILEINGIKMHRSKNIDPLADAALKTKKTVQKNDRVLDTCGGLGYSAMFALKSGAAKVICAEKNREVIELRRLNPWLNTDLEKIELHHADITDLISTFDPASFDCILHDPPRFSSATGDLYGRPFYSRMAGVLKPGGRLFHYTGSPNKIRQNDRFLKNTAKRLEQCGFSAVKFAPSLQGFLASKT